MFEDNGHFLVALLEFSIVIAFLMCLWWVFADLFRSRDLSGVMKALWALLIIVLPLIGVVGYLIARADGMDAREMAYYKAKGLPPA